MQHLQLRPSAAVGRIALILVALTLILLLWGKLVLELAGLIFGGAAFAFLLLPLCHLFEAKLSRSSCALLSLLLAGGILLGLMALLLPAIIRQISTLTTLLPEAFERIGALANQVSDRLQARMPGLQLPNLNLAGSESGIASFAKDAMNYLSGFTGSVYRIFLMVVLSYFFLVDREKIQLRLELLIPARIRCLAVRAGRTLSRELRLYLRGQITIALAVGILAGLTLTFIGVPGAPLMGVFVGIFNVIPYFGPIIGGIPAMLMALSVSWQKALICLGALFLVQQIDGLVISPRVMGNITGFSPAVVLLALFAGGSVGNILGMLLALPALMTLRTLYRIYVQRHEKN